MGFAILLNLQVSFLIKLLGAVCVVGKPTSRNGNRIFEFFASALPVKSELKTASLSVFLPKILKIFPV